MRTCSRCQESKPLDAFRRDSRGFWRSHCKACSLLVTAEWRARHHDELLARRRGAYPVVRVYGYQQHRRAWGPPE